MAAALDKLAKATGHATASDVLVDAATFAAGMREANIDKELSGRLFEFLDEGAQSQSSPPRPTATEKALLPFLPRRIGY